MFASKRVRMISDQLFVTLYALSIYPWGYNVLMIMRLFFLFFLEKSSFLPETFFCALYLKTVYNIQLYFVYFLFSIPLLIRGKLSFMYSSNNIEWLVV